MSREYEFSHSSVGKWSVTWDLNYAFEIRYLNIFVGKGSSWRYWRSKEDWIFVCSHRVPWEVVKVRFYVHKLHKELFLNFIVIIFELFHLFQFEPLFECNSSVLRCLLSGTVHLKMEEFDSVVLSMFLIRHNLCICLITLPVKERNESLILRKDKISP